MKGDHAKAKIDDLRMQINKARNVARVALEHNKAAIMDHDNQNKLRDSKMQEHAMEETSGRRRRYWTKGGTDQDYPTDDKWSQKNGKELMTELDQVREEVHGGLRWRVCQLP